MFACVETGVPKPKAQANIPEGRWVPTGSWHKSGNASKVTGRLIQQAAAAPTPQGTPPDVSDLDSGSAPSGPRRSTRRSLWFLFGIIGCLLLFAIFGIVWLTIR